MEEEETARAEEQNPSEERGSSGGGPKVFDVDQQSDHQIAGQVGTTRRKPDFNGHLSNGKHSNDSIDTVQQLRVAAAAKQNVIDKTGITSRILGHVSSQGRRNQAVRNTRKRT